MINLKMETAVPGLIFRHYQGEQDIPGMVDVLNRCSVADGNDWISTVEEITNQYQHLTNCDPYKDMIMAEVHGEMVGYGRYTWEAQLDGNRRYIHLVKLLPEWRDEGLMQAMAQFNETNLHRIAAQHPPEGEKVMAAFAGEQETQWAELLESAGYQPTRYFMSMVRPSLDNIPAHPLPKGIEVRRGTMAEWRQIWEACREAFKDHWGETEWSEEDYKSWTERPGFDPTLFQIGWADDEVAGGVCNYIDPKENEGNGRLRGYTEDIFVRRPWRKQGLAKALIARSLQMLKEMGMTEAGLSVDADNPTGAVQLYTGLGFERDKESVTYHKTL